MQINSFRNAMPVMAKPNLDKASVGNQTNSQNFKAKYVLEGPVKQMWPIIENTKSKRASVKIRLLCPFDKWWGWGKTISQPYMALLMLTGKDANNPRLKQYAENGFPRIDDTEEAYRELVNKNLNTIYGNEAKDIPRIPFNTVFEGNFDFETGKCLEETSKDIDISNILDKFEKSCSQINKDDINSLAQIYYALEDSEIPNNIAIHDFLLNEIPEIECFTKCINDPESLQKTIVEMAKIPTKKLNIFDGKCSPEDNEITILWKLKNAKNINEKTKMMVMESLCNPVFSHFINSPESLSSTLMTLCENTYR